MSRIDSPLRGAMIFNVGARRSGTLWLQRIVTAHPQVSAVPSETYLFSNGVAPLLERFHHSARSSPAVGTVYAEREALIDAIRDVCDLVFGEFREDGTMRISERTPYHVNSLGLMNEIYPDARFVHIIRDGRDVARSLAARDFGTTSLEKGAEEWRDAVGAARSASLPSDRYREVRYEDLVLQPAATIAKLYSWLKLEHEPSLVEGAVTEAAVAANVDPANPETGLAKWKSEFGPADHAAFERVAGALLSELGYEPAPSLNVGGKKAPKRRDLPSRRLRLRRIGPPRQNTSRGMEWTHPEELDSILGDLLSGRLDALRARLTPSASVRVIAHGRDASGRGNDGFAILIRELDTLQPFAGRQVRGEIHAALPTSVAVFSFRPESGEPIDSVVSLTLEEQRVAELVVHVFPLSRAA